MTNFFKCCKLNNIKKKSAKKTSISKTYVRLAIAAFIIADLIWGAAAPIYKWSMSNVHPFTLAFLRFAIPAFFIGLIWFKQLKIKAKHIPLLVGVALCDVSLNVGLYFFALQYTQSINGPIIGSAGPIFLILGSIFLLKERPTRKMLLGNLIGLTGVLLIVVQPVLQATGGNSSVFGNLLIIGSTIVFAWGTILAKEIRPHYPAIAVTFWSFAIGALTFLPFFIHETTQYGFLTDINSKGIIGILYAILASTTLAYVLYYWAIKHIAASESGIFAYTDPIAAIVIAGPLLNEHPTIIFFLGALMVFAGIYVAEGRIHYHPIHKLLK